MDYEYHFLSHSNDPERRQSSQTHQTKPPRVLSPYAYSYIRSEGNNEVHLQSVRCH